MDLMEPYGIQVYGISGYEAGHKGRGSVDEYGLCHQPGRHEAHDHKPMVLSSPQAYHGPYNGGRSLGAGVQNLQHRLGLSLPHKPHVVFDPETDTCNVVSQGIVSVYGSVDLGFPETIDHRSQVYETSDHSEAQGDTMSHTRQLHAELISPCGSNTDWNPDSPPKELTPTSFSYAPNYPCPNSPMTFVNCQTHPFTYSEPGDVNPCDWRSQGSKDSFSWRIEEIASLDAQLPVQDTSLISPFNDRFDVPHLEEPRSRSNSRCSGTANLPDKPVTIPVDEGGANSGLQKKRKRKPRIKRPRKQRTLTNEGKAHAKAVRECPGGACADCRRRKTKARYPLVRHLVGRQAYTRT